MNTDNWTTLYEANGVVMGEHRDEHGRGSWLVVADEHFDRYRLRFFPGDDGEVGIGMDAWLPGASRMVNYTPSYEYGSPVVTREDVTITDDGLLSVMGRTRGAVENGVDMRIGFTVRLPVAFVLPVRKALELLQTMKAEVAADGS